jgi:hypothetical protein
VDNPIVRLDITQSDSFGQLGYAIDVNAAELGSQIVVGDTWNYQIWYRDGASSNLSDAVEVTFCD